MQHFDLPLEQLSFVQPSLTVDPVLVSGLVYDVELEDVVGAEVMPLPPVLMLSHPSSDGP